MRHMTGGRQAACPIDDQTHMTSVSVQGSTVKGDVTFKFDLSGKSSDFTLKDITHTCTRQASFLGMKSSYYLQCPYIPVVLQRQAQDP